MRFVKECPPISNAMKRLSVSSLLRHLLTRERLGDLEKKKAKREIQVDKMMSKSENNHMVSLSYKHISSAVMTFYLFRHNVR